MFVNLISDFPSILSENTSKILFKNDKEQKDDSPE